MSKHTKGPWQLLPEECDFPYIRVRGTSLGGRFKIANVLTPVYDGAGEREAKETLANARLIAAAPELLAALQDMLCGPYLDSPAVKLRRAKAHAAIAKATGDKNE